MTSKVTYNGSLRTTCVHVKSGNEFITDAPTDNNGKGEAFSPTDTVATGLASCMLTIMGIKANAMEIDLSGTEAEVIKIMASDPRRISEIHVSFHFKINPDTKTKAILERAANTCPVHYSLHPDIERKITFNWGK